MYIDTSKKSKGLGDSIEKFTTYTGIKTIAEAVAKLAGAPGCGCTERKQYLNELFPYSDSSRRFTVLKEFTWNGVDYQQGSKYTIDKNNPIHKAVIEYVRDGYLKEI